MRFLVIGDADAIFLKSLVNKTMIEYNDTVSILSYLNNAFSDYYSGENIKVYREKYSNGPIGILLHGIINLKAFMSKYDIICFHFITIRSFVMLPVAKLFSKRVTFSYWGSDILRVNKTRRFTQFLLQFVDKITMINVSMKDRFCELYGHRFDKKIQIIDFGADYLDIIENTMSRKERIRQKYNIETEKVVIAIGYNNNPEQQHDKVIKKISDLSIEERKRIHLVLRITYGAASETYIDSIKEDVLNTGCSYTIFETYLSDTEIAEITTITDIFIHAQITDAQSTTICEHLFANCLVLNPEWIRYKELEEKVFFLQFKDFDDMYNLLQNNIERKERSRYADKLLKNTAEIKEMCSWNSFIPKWRSIYLPDQN